MTHEQQPTGFGEEAVQFLDWHEAIKAPQNLAPGDIVIGFKDLTEVDVLAHNIGCALLHRRVPEIPQFYYSKYLGWHGHAKPPSMAVRPEHFYGTLSDIGALILDDEVVNAQHKGLFPARGFIVTAAMHVTGKGIQGRFATQCIISTSVATDASGKKSPGLITARYKKLPGNSSEEAAQRILEDSNIAAHTVVLRGLARVFRGGLPGLGK